MDGCDELFGETFLDMVFLTPVKCYVCEEEFDEIESDEPLCNYSEGICPTCKALKELGLYRFLETKGFSNQEVISIYIYLQKKRRSSCF